MCWANGSGSWLNTVSNIWLKVALSKSTGSEWPLPLRPGFTYRRIVAVLLYQQFRGAEHVGVGDRRSLISYLIASRSSTPPKLQRRIDRACWPDGYHRQIVSPIAQKQGIYAHYYRHNAGEKVMSIIGCIVLGLIAGFIASKIVNKTGQGMILDLVLGTVGAVVGGFVFAQFGASGLSGFGIYSILAAVVGAIIVLAIYHLVRGRRGV